MFTAKNKSYRVVLDGEIGGHAMMLVLGCADVQECERFVLKNKDKGMRISSIGEMGRNV